MCFINLNKLLVLKLIFFNIIFFKRFVFSFPLLAHISVEKYEMQESYPIKNASWHPKAVHMV